MPQIVALNLFISIQLQNDLNKFHKINDFVIKRIGLDVTAINFQHLAITNLLQRSGQYF